ncbi:MAG: HAMP domain-containing histidine kinase, partial [Patescibacteria group bacterium]|nr:HAMP domain-containing histidine kinase [Patescibacteria group bacterium]
DDFINLASHELNTPITSLKIFSKVLRNKLESGKVTDTKRYLDKIDEQTNKLIMLITDLLDISRIQTGKIGINKEKFSLSSLMKETVEGLQGTTQIHTIKIKHTYEKEVYADRYRIYQVLVNLLTNAIKYSPRGGAITVAAAKKWKNVIVSVSDNGIGIDKKYQQKIFERLYQVSDVREKTFPGLGIGLFISREIIHMHKGKMWVVSKKGHGATFFFTIPV